MGKLTVNEEEVEGVEVKTVIHRANGDVEVLTVGKERLVVADSEDSPEPEPEPDPPDEPEPPADNVLRRYDYTTEGKEQRGIWHDIPQGQTVSSRLPAGEGKRIYYQQNDSIKPKVDIWLSETPGGESLGRYCQTMAQNKTPKVEYRTDGAGFDWTCDLDPDKAYYINIAHTDPDQPASRINRKIYS